MQNGHRRFLSLVGGAAVAATMGTMVGAHPVGATSPPVSGYAASDLLGQLDSGGNPVWTTDHRNNGSGTVNAQGFDYPQGTALDPTDHLLWVADCANNRVLGFPLDASNSLASHTASVVLGQATMSASAASNAAAGLNCPVGPTYDAAGKRLFVPDDSNSRVVIYNLGGGITSGMPAAYEFGQPTFGVGSSSCAPASATTMCQPYGGSAYDPVTHDLFVSDSGNDRVLVWDLSGPVVSGMAATAVLGQADTVPGVPNFTGTAPMVTQKGLSYPYGLAYDQARKLLFVADDYGGRPSPSRVMIWDLSGGVTSGMNASHVLGQPDFTTSGAGNLGSHGDIDDPEDLAYDPVHQRLFVQDDTLQRFLVFNVSTISNGQDAVAELGWPDFTEHKRGCTSASSVNATTQVSNCDAEGQTDAFDTTNNRLYISDSSNERVLVFNFIKITDAGVLPAGAVGTAYAQAVQTINAQSPLSFVVSSGALPPGLSLDPTSGAITGTPTTSGSYSFSVTVTDTAGTTGTYTDSGAFTMTVGIPVPNTGAGPPAPVLALGAGLVVAGLLCTRPARRRRGRSS